MNKSDIVAVSAPPVMLALIGLQRGGPGCPTSSFSEEAMGYGSARSIPGRTRKRASAKARAADLVRRIERAIERGEFTPEARYLGLVRPYSTTVIGPCGCAIGAAAFLAGAEPDPERRADSLCQVLLAAGLSFDEQEQLEAGYEDWSAPDGPFLDAGRELRKFHPAVSQ